MLCLAYSTFWLFLPSFSCPYHCPNRTRQVGRNPADSWPFLVELRDTVNANASPLYLRLEQGPWMRQWLIVGYQYIFLNVRLQGPGSHPTPPSA